jgi:N-acetylgalactosamine kinase
MFLSSEARRVWEFKRVCEDEASGDARLVKLGQLMNESHESCRDLYACSHPVLDELQMVASKRAYGARLTGAGYVF